MRTKTFATIAVIAAIGLALTALILWIEPRGTSAEGEHAAVAGPLEYPRGPHGARLLSDDTLKLEVTIYESGVPPHFRIYAYDAADKPIAAKDVSLAGELHRHGGRIDRMTFVPEADYLRGEEVVEEPHSFEARFTATHNGKRHQWSYSQIEGKVTLGADQIKSAGIVIATAGPREMVTTIELPGEIKANETRLAHVVPQVDGQVTEVRKQAGDRVTRGEVMAVLSSRELADAKSGYIEATHHVEFTRVALDREEGLWKKKISAERDYLVAKRQFEEAELAEDLAAQKLVALGVPRASLGAINTGPRENLSRYEVRAPLDGTVVQRNVTTGEAVDAEEQIFTVADLSSVWVDITVYAKDLAVVHEGLEATIVSTDLNRTATGKVSYVGPLVGQETRAAIARIVLPNPAGLWRPGLFVAVKLVREATTVPVAVATEGIQAFRDWQVVFVKYGDTFEGRPLELGRSDGEFVEVVKGLKAGEQYAAANSFAIKAEIGKLGATHDH
jgi:membrane fusion protein, heavy metal efflux system